MKTANKIKAIIKTEIDQDPYDPKRLLAAVTELVEARPVQQLEHAIDTLYGFYAHHNQPAGGAIVRAVELITAFLESLEEITTTPGPVNGGFDREFEGLGKRIQALRITAGHSEELVADTIGIELEHLRRIEQGQCGDIRTRLMVEFAVYFNIQVNTLLTEIPQEKFTTRAVD